MKNTHLYLLTIILLFQGCKNDRTPNELEQIIINKSQSDDVIITLNNNSKTTNGITTYENFILVELDKPKYLLDVKFNQKIYKDRCNELVNYLLDSITYDPSWKFDEFRLKIIESHNFLIFKDEKYSMEVLKK